jgi:hypothetical protein
MKYNNKRVYLDDVRFPHMSFRREDDHVDWVILRSYEDFVTWIEENGIPQEVSFDHDLGTEKTGYDAAKYLGELLISENCSNHPYVRVHSANPVGRENIISYFSFIYKKMHSDLIYIK